MQQVQETNKNSTVSNFKNKKNIIHPQKFRNQSVLINGRNYRPSKKERFDSAINSALKRNTE